MADAGEATHVDDAVGGRLDAQLMASSELKFGIRKGMWQMKDDLDLQTSKYGAMGVENLLEMLLDWTYIYIFAVINSTS